MAQQVINVGSAPNDGTGDTLRNSQIKVNANVTELYNAVDLKLDKDTTVDVEKVYIKNADGTQGMKPVSEFGGGSSDIVLNYLTAIACDLTTTELIASINAASILNFSNAVTKSGSLITGPAILSNFQRILKTSEIKKMTYSFFPDSGNSNMTLRIYALKQNHNSSSIYDVRLLFETMLTTTSLYMIQSYEWDNTDFLDSDLNDGEFIAITAKQHAAGLFRLYSQNLTITY